MTRISEERIQNDSGMLLDENLGGEEKSSAHASL
jgi:hypothetical protein